MVDLFGNRRQPASIFCWGSPFVLQSTVSRVRKVNPTRAAACLASDHFSERLREPVSLSRVRKLGAAQELPSSGSALSSSVAGRICDSEPGSREAEPLLTSKSVYGLPARRSRSVLSFDRRVPERGTIEQTKTGRPTQVAQADGWRSFRRSWPLAVFASRSSGGLLSAARLAPKR
jgi:hypothetical protein